MSEELIKALEEAKAGSRELSDEVLMAFGWRKTHRAWNDARGRAMQPYPAWVTPDGVEQGYYFSANSPTESVDDALALVPEGYDEEIKRARHRRGWFVALWRPERIGHVADAATPALALCAAVLRATPTTLGED